jgi:hypothetical protein
MLPRGSHGRPACHELPRANRRGGVVYRPQRPSAVLHHGRADPLQDRLYLRVLLGRAAAHLDRFATVILEALAPGVVLVLDLTLRVAARVGDRQRGD